MLELFKSGFQKPSYASGEDEKTVSENIHVKFVYPKSNANQLKKKKKIQFQKLAFELKYHKIQSVSCNIFAQNLLMSLSLTLR